MPLTARTIANAGLAVAAALLTPAMLAHANAGQAAAKLQCNRSNMPGKDVKACADLAANPKLPARDRSNIYLSRAAAWLMDDEPGPAVADFTRAIEADASNLAALSGRARANGLLGKHDLAAEDWSRVIKLSPDKGDGYTQRGGSFLAAGRSQDALADFTKAIEIEPGHPDGYIGRARAYDQLNDRPKVLHEFDLAIAAGPELWSTYLARAEMADRWGDKQMAIANYLLVVKYNNRYWNAYKALHRLGVERHLGDTP